MRVPAHDELLVVVAHLGVIAGDDPRVRIGGRAEVVSLRNRRTSAVVPKMPAGSTVGVEPGVPGRK